MKHLTWIVLCVALAATGGAQGRRTYLREAAQAPGPRAVVTRAFDAWIQDDQLHFRSAGWPAGEPFQKIKLPGSAQRIAVAGDRVYVWLNGGRLVEFSVGTDGPESPRDLPVDDPVALAALQPPVTMQAQASGRADVTINPARLLVTNSESGTVGSISGDSVTAIDTSTNQVITTLSLNPGDSPYDATILPDNTQAFIANFGCQNCIDRGVSVLDPLQMTSLKRFASALPSVVVLSPDGSRLYVGDDVILRTFDTTTGSQIAALDLLVPIQSIAVRSSGQTLYVIGSNSRSGDDILSVVNAASPGTLGTRYTFPSGSVCGASVMAPGDQRLYVSCSNPATIYPVNILSDGTLSVTTSFATTRAFSLAFSPDGRKLYLPHFDSSTVEAIDPSTGSRLGLIQVQTGPVTMVVNRAGTRGYTSNYTSNSVSVIDLTTDTVIANVPVGPSPVGLALTATALAVTAAPTQFSFAGTAGQANPAPQNLTLSLEGGSANWGAAVATVTGGSWLSVSAVTGTFPATLQVSVNLAGLPPGVFTGTITISPSLSGGTPVAIPVSLLLSAASGGPAVPAGGIVNAASFAANTPVSAASLVSIFGTNLGPATGVPATDLPLPTLLSNVKVRMNDILAPLIYVSAGQINCQIPVELAGQSTVQVVVQNGDLPGPPTSLNLVPAAPGIFTASVNNRMQGAVLNKDSTLNTPANPARLGDIIQIYATGQGQVSNAPASGSPAPSDPLATTPVNPVVLIGGRQADIAFSGLAPGFVGLWQINAVVPATISAGDAVTVQVVHGGTASNTTTIAVTAIPPP